jgi:UMF1 family MFS transporter
VAPQGQPRDSMTDRPAEVSTREIWGWGLYDFANSPFATTILAVIFNRYFAEVLAGGEQGVVINLMGRDLRIPGVTLFTYTLATSMLIVAVLAPVLGAVADSSGSKKKFLAFFCYLGVGATAMLYFAHAGQYWRGAIFFILAQVGFAAGNIFYNAVLPEISTTKNIGWISGFGFTLGYISGAAVLAINLAMLSFPQWIGFDAPFTPQDTFLSVAVWWGVFAIPTFLWLRERRPAVARPAGSTYLRVGLSRVGKTLRNLRRYRELTKFLIAFLIYNDGIQTTIVVAAIFVDEVLGFSDGAIVGLFLMIQATAFVGALLMGSISDRIGNKTTITITLLAWTGVAIWGRFIGFTGSPTYEVFAIGIVVGMVLGGSQSASRALQGTFTPDANSAEFFAFYGIAGKFSAVLGPLVYGSVYALIGIRSAILSLGVFFVVGLVILHTVNEEEGARQAQTAVT